MHKRGGEINYLLKTAQKDEGYAKEKWRGAFYFFVCNAPKLMPSTFLAYRGSTMQVNYKITIGKEDWSIIYSTETKWEKNVSARCYVKKTLFPPPVGTPLGQPPITQSIE